MALQPGASFMTRADPPQTGARCRAGRGRPAARWVTGWVVQDGRIANYQIVAPTHVETSAPAMGPGSPRPVEQALAGAPVQPGETTPISVPAHRAQLRPVHGVHGSLMTSPGYIVKCPAYPVWGIGGVITIAPGYAHGGKLRIERGA